jgi:hypothetical protein
MKWNRLILLLLCAIMAMGGTFICKSGDGDSSGFTTKPPRESTTR